VPSVKDLFDMSGHVAVVTGGGTHLGTAMAEAMGELGATVVLASRRLEVCEEAAAGLRKSGIDAHAARCDATDEGEVQALVDGVVAKHGRLDVMLCNAGGSPSDDDTPDADVDKFREAVGMNIDSTFICAQAAARVMIERGGGKIIAIGSTHGVMGTDKRLYEGLGHKRSSIGYFAAKGGVVNLTRALAAEYGEYNITVNCLSPGQIPKSTVKPEMVERMRLRQPIRRTGQPHDLKGAVALLASPAGDWITGLNLMVDGGWSVF
jgi:NAD(P)-dependent dehydrogenase (short-subunit alcohol dehydrogenase family)